MKKAEYLIIFITICCLLTLVPVYANALEADIITEDEVLQAVESLGKDKAAGNIFLWFLCALAFLKVSTKMDSLMAALGINVARTAGSMLGDTMMIMKSMNMLTGGGFMGRGHSSSGSSNDSGGGSFLEGGLAGVIGRQVTQSAVQSATDTGGNVLANKMFESSLSGGGQFAQNIIGQIATGDINKTGTISGDKAATALTAYFGDNLNDSVGVMPFVESNNDGFMPIGDQENIAETAPTQIAGGINNMEALNESELQEIGTFPGETNDIYTSMLNTEEAMIISEEGSGFINQEGDSPVVDINQDGINLEENPIIQDSTAVQVDNNMDQGVQVPADTEGVAITQTPIESSDLATVEPTTTPVSDVSGVQINSNPYASDKGIEQVETPNIGVDSSGPTVPAYTDVEIGGGRITGKEISSEHPEGIKFGMYSADKYMEPQGKHSVVESIDGNKWYKQYAVDTVQKTPVQDEETGKIKFKSEIVKSMPPVPPRKDRL